MGLSGPQETTVSKLRNGFQHKNTYMGTAPGMIAPRGNSSVSVGIFISLKENIGNILKYHVYELIYYFENMVEIGTTSRSCHLMCYISAYCYITTL